MAKSVSQTVARYQAGTAGAQSAYVDGIKNTQADVVGNAIRAKDSLLQNFNNAVQSGRWERALVDSGGTANWKTKSEAKAANYGVGVQAGQQKYANAMAKLIPFIDQVVMGLPQKQAGNLAVSLQRVSGLMSALHNAKGQFKG
jgi:hypothetical protein